MPNNSRELFEYYRFLLAPIEEPELPFCSKKSREEVISDIFSIKKVYRFTSHGIDYALCINNRDESYASATIGKRVRKNIRTSPDEGFKTKEIEDWPGCDLFINLSNEHETGKTKQNGQLIIVQVNNIDVKYRYSLLQKLAKVINKEIAPYGFFLSINPIPSEKTKFWNVVSENKGKIKKITFSYIPPNLLNLQSSLEEDLKQISNDFNTTKVQISLENNDGNLELSPTNQLLKESAEYVDLGAGIFKLQFKGNKKPISSDDNIKTEAFSNFEISMRAQELTKEQLRNVMRILLEK